MKYPIIIFKICDKSVMAVCPLIKSIQAEGSDMDSALEQIKKKFLCYLHDDDIQLEVMPFPQAHDFLSRKSIEEWLDNAESAGNY